VKVQQRKILGQLTMDELSGVVTVDFDDAQMGQKCNTIED
jgi:hypothetical protein